MNRENLQRMADYIRTVPQESFNMKVYRDGSKRYHKCNSVGCVIGHCTALDDIDNIPTLWNDEINFHKWSENYTGLIAGKSEWIWCFDAYWIHIDNTPTGAADRIEWLLKHGLPKDWLRQMNGENPLIYRTDESK
jgi:hypothetical protein